MASLVYMERKDSEVCMERRDKMGKMASQVHLQRKVCVERRDNRVYVERRDSKVYVERKECMEIPACKGLKENRESRVHHQEESPTLAGVGQPAPLARELSWCMQAELGELTISTKEEQPTISVCLIILTICNIRVEYKVQVM